MAEKKSKISPPVHWKQLALWKHQVAAIELCDKYLNNPQRSALIQMPTGTGKTGIIAVLAAKGLSPVLVLSPSQAISDQLFRDVKSTFWERINAVPWKVHDVNRLLPSHEAQLQQALKETGKKPVFVGTIQSLEQIERDRKKLYAELRQRVGLVLVDEGHREPSPEWASAVRGLQKPTILFSATPYRNDFQLFDVSDESIFFLSFDDAVAKHLIRDVKFQSLGVASTPEQFVKSVITAYDGLRKKHLIAKNAKVIIRCATEPDVTSIHDQFVQQLKQRPEKCLAFHDRYTAHSASQLKDVPDLRTRDEQFLIHQFKLIEGVDDPRCAVLALYAPFQTDRQLVQQIGRIIRHPSPLTGTTKPAVVLAEEIGSIRRSWDRYKTYDLACKKNHGRPPIRNEHKIVSTIVDALPESEYIAGKFRQKADFQDLKAEDVFITRSCVTYRVTSGFSLPAFRLRVRQALLSESLIVVHESGDDKSALLLSVELRHSPLLATASFPELELHATVIHCNGTFLFTHDTAGIYIDELSKHLTRLQASHLRCLLPDDLATKVTAISLLNADIGPSAVRSRSFTAPSLADAVPFMGDYLNVVSRASGRTPNGVRRYVGFSRGRVRQEEGSICNVGEFIDWTTDISSELVTQSAPSTLFSRFANPTSAPNQPEPLNILLDLDPLKTFVDENGVQFTSEDVCSSIQPATDADNRFTHAFIVNASGTEAEVHIGYEKDRERYLLRSADLDKFTEVGNPKITLTKRLNQKQSFRIIPETPGIVYALKQFYDVNLRLEFPGLGSVFLELLTPIADLLGAEEKGKGTGTLSTWPSGSVFRIIDDGIRPSAQPSPFGHRFPTVICEDIGNEFADFVAFDEKEERVVYVHAKGLRDGTQLAASALYDICGQAVKNLAYLRFGTQQLPGDPVKWDGDWSNGKFKVQHRIRTDPKKAGVLRPKLLNLLQRPNTTREVWIVLGNILSRSAVQNALTSGKANPVLLQSFYLIMSTYSACKSVGVDLRIMCHN